MNEPSVPTKGDAIQPAVDQAKRLLAATAQWAREHPDELAVGIAPCVLLAMATRRHPLSWGEALVISEAGYWLGLAAVKQYRTWKSRPAGPIFKRVM